MIQPPSRPPRMRLCLGPFLVVAACMLGGGCGKSDPDTSAWGGMSEDEWRAQRKARQEDEAKQIEADKKAREEAKARAKQPPAGNRVAEPPKKVRSTPVSTPLPTTDGPPPLSYTDELPPPPRRSDTLADWDEHDLYAARMSGDARLIAALQLRAANPRRTEAEAAVYADILAPFAFGEVRDPNGRVLRGKTAAHPPAALIAAVTAALASNGTPMSRDVLERLLAESLVTEDPKAALDGALAALLKQNHPEANRLVLRAIMTPEAYRHSGPGAVPAATLRQQALAQLKQHASPEMRLAMARMLASPEAPREAVPLLAAILREPTLANLPAQVVYYGNATTEPAVRTALETRFAAVAAETLETALGLSPLPGGNAITATDARAAAATLWADSFAAFLDVKHQGITSLPTSGPLLATTAAIPTDLMRQRLLRTLDRHWQDGPGVFRTAGFTSNRVADPGLILVIKAGLRRNGSAIGSKTPKAAPLRPSDRKPTTVAKTEAEQDWRKLIMELAQTYCRRCHATSLDRDAAARRDGRVLDRPTAADLPVPLHPDAEITAWHGSAWPGAVGTPPPGVTSEPFALRYVRVEEKAKPSRVLGYYRRQVRGAEETPTADGVWLTGHGEAATGRLRDIELFISRAKSGAAGGPDEECHLTVEMLIIETRDMSLDSRVANRTNE